MHAAKLMLTVLAGGPILGLLTGLAVQPELRPAPEAPWRHQTGAIIPSSPVENPVEAAPEDTTPYGLGRAPTWASRLATSEPVQAPVAYPAEPSPARAGQADQTGEIAPASARDAALADAAVGADAPEADPAAASAPMPETPTEPASERSAIVL